MHKKAVLLALAGFVLTQHKGLEGSIRIKRQRSVLESYIGFYVHREVVWRIHIDAGTMLDRYVEVPWDTVSSEDWDNLDDDLIQKLIERG